MSAGELLQILYHSRRSPGTTDGIVVDHIVLLSAAKNRLLGLTGRLWYGPTRFVQVLEGEAAVVEGVYASIARDFRHHDVRCVLRVPIDERTFGAWSVAPLVGEESEAVATILGRFGVGAAEGRGARGQPRTVVQRLAELLSHRHDAVHAHE